MPKALLRAAASPAPAAGGSTSGASASSTAAAAVAKSSGPRKLLSENFELQLEEAGQQLSDATDFTVIGVLGAQGVGKSTIMSLLAGAPWAAGGGTALHDAPFTPQPHEVVLQAAHQTSGIDLFVTGERLILLDTQPLLSPSVLLDLMKREASVPADVQTYENLMELHSLRLAMLLLSTCHMVICMHDVLLDPAGLRTLRLAKMLCHRLPDISVLAMASPPAAQALVAAATTSVTAVDTERLPEAAPTVAEYSAHVAFVFNRMAPEAFAPQQQAALRSVLARLFSNSPAEATASSAGGVAGASTAAECEEANADDGSPPLVLLLPEGSGRARVNAMHLSFAAEAEAARDALLAQRRVPFARSMSEREWLRGVGRMWDAIKRSALLADYNRAMQKLHLFA